MRIAIIIDGLRHGGAERQAVTTTAALANQGHRVTLISYGKINEFQEMIHELRVDMVQIHQRGLLRIPRVRELVRLFKREKFDVVYCFKHSTSMYGALAGILAGVPCVMASCRGFEWFGFRSRWAKANWQPNWCAVGWRSIPFRRLNRYISSKMAGWTVNSRALVEFAAHQFNIPSSKVSVVYNGVPDDMWSSGLDKEQARDKFGVPAGSRVISIIASLRPVKNHAMFLRVAASLHKQLDGPPLTFMIAGQGVLEAELRSQAQDSGLGDAARFLGSRNDIPDLLRASDVVVSTSWSEGLPNALIEAAMLGVPCVCTSCGGSPEVVLDGKTGFVVNIDDDEAMASQIVRLLTDAELYRSMADEASRMAKMRFSEEVLADNLSGLFRQHLAQS